MKPNEKPSKKKLNLFTNFRKNFDLLASRVKLSDYRSSPEEPVLLNCSKRCDSELSPETSGNLVCHNYRPHYEGHQDHLQLLRQEGPSPTKDKSPGKKSKVKRTNRLFSGLTQEASSLLSVTNTSDPQENNEHSCNSLHSSPSDFQAIRAAEHEIENFKRRFLLPRLTEKDSLNESGYGPESSVDTEETMSELLPSQPKDTQRETSMASDDRYSGDSVLETDNFQSLRRHSELTEGMLLELNNQATESDSSQYSPIPASISDSEYDSGAFSRTSSPENGLTKSMNMINHEPLISPPLVLSAVKDASSKTIKGTINPNLVLSCLSEAGKSSKFSLNEVQTRNKVILDRSRRLKCSSNQITDKNYRKNVRKRNEQLHSNHSTDHEDLNYTPRQVRCNNTSKESNSSYKKKDEAVTVTIGLTSQLSVTTEGDFPKSLGGTNVSLPDISNIGSRSSLSHLTVMSPLHARHYNSTSSLHTTTTETEPFDSLSERKLPCEFNSSFYTISLISPEIDSKEAKETNQNLNNNYGLYPASNFTKMISSQKKKSTVCHLNCSSKVTVNGKHHCSKFIL